MNDASASSATRPVCVLTGSTGYVGGGLRRALEAAGWTVRDPFAAGQHGRRRRLGDPVPDEELAGAGLFVHCAYDFRPGEWTEIERVNVRASQELFEQARQAGAKRVFISSASAYQGCRSLYGQAKLAVEETVLAGGGLVLRPGLVYGAQPAGGMVAKLTRLVQRLPLLPVVGGRQACLGLTHLEDLGRTVAEFGSHDGPAPCRAVQASDGQRYSLRQVLELLAAQEGRRRWFLPVPAAPLYGMLWLAGRLRLPLNLRVDNLKSLLNQDPQPDFRRHDGLHIVFRPFHSQTQEA